MILNNFNLSLKKKYSLSFSYWNIEKQITKKTQKLKKYIKKRYQEKNMWQDWELASSGKTVWPYFICIACPRSLYQRSVKLFAHEKYHTPEKYHNLKPHENKPRHKFRVVLFLGIEK